MLICFDPVIPLLWIINADNVYHYRLEDKMATAYITVKDT